MREYRQDFPILHQSIDGKPLVYLDNAATSQKPEAVLVALDHYYRTYNANVHRGIYTLSEMATDAYEGARTKIAAFINAPDRTEVVYTRNTSEALNLVAYTWGRKNLGPGDAVLITEMEHHSNIVPWQILQKERGFDLKFIPVTEQGTLDLTDLDRLLERVKIVSFMHMSNVLGTINPVKQIVEAAHKVGALVMVDGAQSVPHFPVNVQDLGVDFYAFSGHKAYGPTGIGVLWGRTALLNEMDPFLGGGDMISEVFMDRCTYADLPHKFEAGTPAIAQAIGLGAAVDYLAAIGMEKIAAYENELTEIALRELQKIDGLRIFGNAPERGAAISFALEGIHPHDLATILSVEGVAIRAGNHCAQPLTRKFGVAATARASFALYNVPEEIDALTAALNKAKAIFSYVR
jgi:cysteine desulfurase / selenocysteine lyase